MNKSYYSVLIVFGFISAILSGCGSSRSIGDELEMVPGLCFLHVHVGSELNTELIPDDFDRFLPLWLCDSLRARGDFAVSLLGINLTDFSPQLLFLSSNIETDELVELGTYGFNCGFEEANETFNLIDDRGGLAGSIASRNGWTCLATGSGADRAARRWLELEKNESLASDADLLSISESEGDLTILVSQNSIAFVSVIPTGMLSRTEISMLARIKSIIQALDPRALRISLDIMDEEPPVTQLEFQLVRGENDVTVFSLSFSDTELTPNDIFRAAAAMIN